jgi:1,4-dihydroxy-2-naphthoyl-CoA hydrolase
MKIEKSIWVTPLNLDALNNSCKNSLLDHLGIQFSKLGPDFLSATMDVDQRTMQPMGILHGGASAALAETVGSAAGNYCVDGAHFFCVGLDLNINHIRPILTGSIEAIAKPFHLGKRTHVWDIQIIDEKERLVAVARLTLMVVRKDSFANAKESKS